MKINPFKDTNLRDLQLNLIEFVADHFSGLSQKVNDWLRLIDAKGKERITVMFIPHSEKRIVNFHLSIYALTIFSTLVVATVTITSLIIINHSSTVKEVSKLKKYGTNSKQQISRFKDESNKLYESFQRLKPEITHLYSLTPGSDIDSLWGKGGDFTGKIPEGENNMAPPVELLNIQEVERELKTTKKVLSKIKSFLEIRKKIIENTPSVWPVNGYIVSRFGKRSSPYTFEEEFHNGIDIETFPSAEIKATAPGIINDIKWDPSLGLTVSIKHKYGFITVYSHCQRVAVEPGQKVSKGEVIGYVGRTGKTTRYICQYQIKIGTEYTDPMPYLNKIRK